MRLKSISVKNFRQFYEKQPKIKFAHGKKNITVIHACNGGGKTALLNAFSWTLFDSLTTGFLFPEQIVNKRSIREASPGNTVEAWVEIEFEHNSKQYVVRREATATKRSPKEWTNHDPLPPTLQWAGSDGKWNREDNVYDAIGRVLPSDLHTYFFFDGERIERLTKPLKKEKKNFADATKKLLGIEIFHRAERHLNKARTNLENELEKIGDAETAKLIQEKRDKVREVNARTERVDEIETEVESHKVREGEIQDRLRKISEVKTIQEKRDRLNDSKKSYTDSLSRKNRELSDLLSTAGYSLFLDRPLQSFTDMIEDLRERGELPSGIKKQFVADLLNEGICICNRELTEGSSAHAAVTAWQQKAGLADVEEKALRMGGEIKQLSQTVPTTFDRLLQIQNEREDDRSSLSQIENDLDNINDKLKNSPNEEAADLELQLEQLDETIGSLEREKGSKLTLIEQSNNRISELDTLITKHEANQEQQKVAQERVTAAKDARLTIIKIREALEKNFRKGLEVKVANLFKKISPTPYTPKLNDDYTLELLESAGGAPLPVAASTGEFQILSLAFIGSIIEEAREYHSKREGLPGPDASSYPVVMDSPFGSLDPIYRYQIAENLPLLADQIVILVSQTQWRGEVEQTMHEKIGNSYVLTYNTPKDGFKDEGISLNGHNYSLIQQSPNAFEFTKICEV